MAQTVGDFIHQRLRAWGVQRVFGYPGDGINGIMAAFEHAGDEGPRFIQARHEELAAFMAGAHAKFTGEPGVCLATSGPGAIHLLNGLYDAKLDHQPVVAIVGQSARTGLGANYQQEVDLQVLFKDVASEFVQYCMTPEQARHLIDRAVRVAQASRSVTCVIVPEDVQESPYSAAPPRVVPREEDLRAAADLLNSGEKVMMLVGQGAIGAEDEVIEAAELLG